MNRSIAAKTVLLASLICLASLTPTTEAQIVNDGETNTLSGVTTFYAGDVTVGWSNSFTRLNIVHGAVLTNSGAGYIGRYYYNIGFAGYSSKSNLVVIDGMGSRWDLDDGIYNVFTPTNLLSVGHEGSYNTLLITNGGVVKGDGAFVGYGGSHNLAIVSGVNSAWTNFGGLSVGGPGEASDILLGGLPPKNNRLIIEDGAKVQSVGGTVGARGSSQSNEVLVQGSNSLWAVSGALRVEGFGSNSLQVTGGGEVNIILTFGNDGTILTGPNQVIVSDPGSKLSGGSFIVGFGANNSLLLITNGGHVSSGIVPGIGYVGGDNNRSVVVGINSSWITDYSIDIGWPGGKSNALLVADGGLVKVPQNVRVGWVALNDPSNMTIDSQLVVKGGTLAVTNENNASGVLSVSGAGSEILFEGGSIVADELQMPRETCAFHFRGGILSTASATISNAAPFTVGDGTNSANYFMRGVVTNLHTFYDGLVISSNATLTGSGTIIGAVTNRGVISPGASIGKVQFNNPPVLTAAAVLDLEIGGFTPGSEHDQLAVQAGANLDGTVRATLINHFLPKKDDAFTVLTYASRTGEFATIESAEPERIVWRVEYGATSAQLIVVNTAPTLAAITNQTVNEQTLLSLTASATDRDLPAQSLTYSLDTAPAGMIINASSGLISWIPTEAQGPGVHNVTVRVTDNGTPALAHTTSFSVTVNEVNVVPQLVLPGAQTVAEEVELVFTINGTDADVPTNALTYELVSAPPSATFNATTREFRWTPTEAQGPGNFTATFRVTDNNPDAVNSQQLSTTGGVSIAVNEVNRVPLLTVPGSQTVDEGTLFSATSTATDPDLPANLLTYSLVAPPAGMTINPGSGAISWTPTEAQGPFTNTITVVVTDTNPPAANTTSLSVTKSFTLTVNEVNLAPTLLPPANRTIHAGTTLSASASATDPDLPVNTFSYSKLSGPAGVNVSVAGLITWNTGDTDANTTNVIALMVTDNGVPNLSHTNSFVVTVNSRPLFTSITRTGSVATAVWTAIPGTGYRLQYKTNLDAAAWGDLIGDVTAGGATATKADATLGTNASRFYRVFVLP